ncbi:hypothetical protein LL037_07765 [Clostridium estertheticum]|uniref:DUF2178 domain-containing protein n=1 Tax=Clostridium estertheticum TaxID=238834 RepID=A0AA47EH83_9CLOT|nr:hypothetical protein [Clostridium estertheticum]MBU3156471.1 hypothetical protein [Clostridium estertheticum]MBU3199883.1 hypothetical protein [Clostridium estertheticum]WAG58926.1 hypothetical protein LL038_14880 [Clostridium estertheticum]WAG67018.1 hypothetical protein LL037_07765 [Clostridium estertheticum]
MKIYNNKGFILGVLSLLFAIAEVVLFFVDSSKSSIILLIILTVTGIEEIIRSLNKKSSIEDKDSEDEREKFIFFKSGNITCIITFCLCILFLLILSVQGVKWWGAQLVGPIVTTLSIISATMVLVWFSSYLFYNKKN